MLWGQMIRIKTESFQWIIEIIQNTSAFAVDSILRVCISIPHHSNGGFNDKPRRTQPNRADTNRAGSGWKAASHILRGLDRIIAILQDARNDVLANTFPPLLSGSTLP